MGKYYHPMSLAYVEAWFWYFRHIYKQRPLRTKPVNPAEPPPVVSQSNTSQSYKQSQLEIISLYRLVSLYGVPFLHISKICYRFCQNLHVSCIFS